MYEKKRIAIIAYAFSPTRGSEYAQGWNYAKELSKYHEVSVYVGSSDGHIGGMSEIQHLPEWLNVKVNKIELNKFVLKLYEIFVKIRLPWLFVLTLRYWNTVAVQRIQRDHSIRPFTHIHHLGPVGFKTPSNLSNFNVPRYWGPIGGLQYVNSYLAWNSSKRYYFIVLLRNILTWIIARGWVVRFATKNFEKFSFCTQQNYENFNQLYGIEGPIISDQAADEGKFISLTEKPSAKILEVVWCGSVDGRKNPKLLLDVAIEANKKNLAINFTLIGDGYLLKKIKKIAVMKKINNITFTGRINRAEVDKYMRQSDVLMFTSLSEANTSTFFEGIENLLIPICMDLDGFSTNINPKIGFKIDSQQKYTDIVSSYIVALEKVSNLDVRHTFQAAICSHRGNMTWAGLIKKHMANFTA